MGSAIKTTAFQDATLHKLVVPVRYLSGDEVVHTTSTMISAEGVHIRSARPPAIGSTVQLKLYFPGPAAVVSRTAVVAGATTGSDPGFWAEFTDRDEGARTAAAHTLVEANALPVRPLPRHETRLDVLVRGSSGTEQRGVIRNLSGTGAFIELDETPPLSSRVDLEIGFPGHPRRESVHGYVVHVAETSRHGRRGVGVQFGSGGAAFRLALDGYLARLR